MECRTEKMIMRTNIKFDNGHLYIPAEEKQKEIDLLNNKSNVGEDGGFIFYDDNNSEICHIAIRTDRKSCEISYGTKEQFRKKGYMQEALSFLLRFFSKNGLNEDVYALICNNPVSEHILKKNGFEKEHSNESGGDWFVFK